MSTMNFEPYFDFAAVDEEMAADLHESLREYRRLAEEFTKADKPNVELAQKVLAAHREAEHTLSSIKESIFRQPVMVHKAGPKKVEANPDDESQSGYVQRCVRCGSPLGFFAEGTMVMDQDGPRPLEEDDVPWWDEGDIVAKASGHFSMGMYAVGDRELERHEHECVSLNELEFSPTPFD